MFNAISKKGLHDSNPDINQHDSPIVKDVCLLVDRNKNLFKTYKTENSAVGSMCVHFIILD